MRSILLWPEVVVAVVGSMTRGLEAVSDLAPTDFALDLEDIPLHTDRKTKLE
jgi:hypothetical protein